MPIGAFKLPGVGRIAGPVVSVEYVEVSGLSGVAVDSTVNLTLGQNYLHCVPFMTRHQTTYDASSGNLSNCHVQLTMVNNAGTGAIRIRCSQIFGTQILGIYVVQFDPAKVRVQQVTIPNNTGTGSSVAITAVNLAKTWAVFYGLNSNTGAQSSPAVGAYRCYFGSTTSINIDRNTANTQNPSGTAYVVEDIAGNMWDVVEVTGTLSGTGTTSDQAISAVDLSKTWCIGSWKTTCTTAYDSGGTFRLSSTTNLRFQRNSAVSQTIVWTAFVVKMLDATTVQHGAYDNNVMANTDTVRTEDYTITAVNLSKAIVISTAGQCSTYNSAASWVDTAQACANEGRVSFKLTSTTNVRMSNFQTSLNEVATVFDVIEWAMAA